MSKKGTLTIKDIAAATAVGLGTVSRAINGKPGVKPELRRKILAYIEDVGWSSSSLAERLNGGGKEKQVLFVVSPHNVFRSGPVPTEYGLLDLLLDRCSQEGYETLILTGRRSETLEQCRKLRPFAVIQPSSIERLCPQERELADIGTRLITLSFQKEPTGVTVHPDYAGMGTGLARVLRRAGHRKIGFFGEIGPRERINSFDEAPTNRLRQTIDGIRKAHPDLAPEDVFSDNYGNPARFEEALEQRRYTGWICSNWDTCAMFLAAAWRLKLRIPEDVSLITISPEQPSYLYPIDVNRCCLNVRSGVELVMNLLSAGEFPIHTSVLCPHYFHKGVTVSRPIQP